MNNYNKKGEINFFLINFKVTLFRFFKLQYQSINSVYIFRFIYL